MTLIFKIHHDFHGNDAVYAFSVSSFVIEDDTVKYKTVEEKDCVVKITTFKKAWLDGVMLISDGTLV